MKNRKKNKGKIIIGVVIVILIFTLLGYVFGNKVRDVLVKDFERYVVEKGDLSLTAVGSGKILSSNIKKVIPSGTINEIKVEIGDYIKKGETLGTVFINNRISTFVSPYNGVITNVPGSNSFAILTNYFEVSDINNLELVIQVTEKDIVKINNDASASIYIDAFGLELEGKVSRISLIGKGTGDLSVYDVTISFEKGDLNIYLGMTGSARINIETKEDIVLIPIDALIKKKAKKYVLDSSWLDNINRPQSDYYIEVETGIADPNYVEITKGDILGKEILIIPPDNNSFPMMMEKHE
ncbi:MAG: hypothetical protein PHS45_02490 [Bacilli bacterium]|nr:hypothetical protein [Bacilli bacterium]